MMMQLYYAKHPNFLMDQQDAGKLTLADLAQNYELMVKAPWPNDTTPDDVFAYYQDRAIPLPPDIEHTSMSVGDIVLLGRNVFICCICGWYAVELSNIKTGDILNAS